MVSYDGTAITLLVSAVLAVALIGIALAVGLAVQTLSHHVHTRPARRTVSRRHVARLAFHH